MMKKEMNKARMMKCALYLCATMGLTIGMPACSDSSDNTPVVDPVEKVTVKKVATTYEFGITEEMYNLMDVVITVTTGDGKTVEEKVVITEFNQEGVTAGGKYGIFTTKEYVAESFPTTFSAVPSYTVKGELTKEKYDMVKYFTYGVLATYSDGTIQKYEGKGQKVEYGGVEAQYVTTLMDQMMQECAIAKTITLSADKTSIAVQ